MKTRTKAIDGNFEIVPSASGTHLQFSYNFPEA
jgi:hypothetical protein